VKANLVRLDRIELEKDPKDGVLRPTARSTTTIGELAFSKKITGRDLADLRNRLEKDGLVLADEKGLEAISPAPDPEPGRTPVSPDVKSSRRYQEEQDKKRQAEEDAKAAAEADGELEGEAQDAQESPSEASEPAADQTASRTPPKGRKAPPRPPKARQKSSGRKPKASSSKKAPKGSRKGGRKSSR